MPGQGHLGEGTRHGEHRQASVLEFRELVPLRLLWSLQTFSGASRGPYFLSNRVKDKLIRAYYEIILVPKKGLKNELSR